MSIQTTIRYLNPEVIDPSLQNGVQKGHLDAGRASTITVGSKESRKQSTIKTNVTMYDARQLPTLPTLDKNGVELVTLASKVKDYHNEEEIKGTLYKEVEELVRKVFGAKYVYVASHNVRSEDPEAEGKRSGQGTFTHAYARYAHLDTGPNSELMTRKSFKKLFGLTIEECGPERMDVAMANVWKPYDRPVAQNPLAVLDCQSLDFEKEGVTAGYQNAKVQSLVTQLLEGPQHKWLYFKHQQIDEALIFKQLDTREGRAKYGFHTSFDDPTAPADAPGRRSIEFFVILGFPKPAASL